ncbi:MAG: hypothetical protein ACRETL_03720, partial [Gammaproteobacteria bacterium]
ELFRLFITKTFEPAGEECGTLYDEGSACPVCGSGARQDSDLYLDARRIPREAELSRTIADEWVASRHLVDLIEKTEIKGMTFRPVFHQVPQPDGARPGRSSRKEVETHRQLVVTSRSLAITSPTKTGENPFDSEASAAEYRCSLGDNIGHGYLSELYVSRADWDGADIMVTRQMVGPRRGLIRPTRALLVRPRLRRLFLDNRVKKVAFEVAHFT